MSHPSRSLPSRCGPVCTTTRNRDARPGLKSALAALPGTVALALGAWGLVGAGAAWAQTSPGASSAPAAAESGQLTTITLGYKFM